MKSFLAMSYWKVGPEQLNKLILAQAIFPVQKPYTYATLEP